MRTDELAIPAERQAQLERMNAAAEKNGSAATRVAAGDGLESMFAGKEGLDAGGQGAVGGDLAADMSEKQMNAFVELEMEKLRHAEASAAGRGDVEGPAAATDDGEEEDNDDGNAIVDGGIDLAEDRLYETPAELQVKSSAQRKLEAGIGNDSATGVAAEGLSSLGIMEVDLPIEAKVRSIQQ